MDMPETALDTRSWMQSQAIEYYNGRGFTAKI